MNKAKAAFLALATGALGLCLATLTDAEAARSCKHGGKQYSVNSTRCEAGAKLRCQGEDRWKEIGTCKAKAAPKGPQRCNHGGKSYSIGSTRCENNNKLRCVKAETWKRIAACKR